MSTLKELRIEKGWTQTDLASLANVPRSTISRIELGVEVGFSARTMKKVADVLGVKVSDIEEFAAKMQATNQGPKEDRPAAYQWAV